MRELCNGKLGSEEKVMRFAEWVNEIHNWGLGSWTDAFLDDVKILLRESSGAWEVVGFTTEELQAGLRGDDDDA